MRRLLPWLPLVAAILLGAMGIWLESMDARDANSADLLLVPLLAGYSVVGGLITAREPRNAVGWLLIGISLANIGAFAVGRYAIAGFDGAVALPFPQIGAALAWTWIVALACPVLLAFLVPTGRPLSPAWRRVFYVVAGVLVLVVLVFALGDPGGGNRSTTAFRNPIFVPFVEPLYEFLNAAFVIYIVLFAVGALALAVRFRRSRGAERQQLKWIFLGMVGMLAGLVISNVTQGILSDVIWALGMLPLPASLAVAILRFRLYDIDLVIKRTVTYAAISVFLVGIEVGGILLLQELLSGITGSETYAVAGSTLAVAALFQPTRRRTQSWVDRRFDRDHYDMEQVAAGFGSRLRDRVDLGDVETELLTAATGTLRPTQAWVWIRNRGGR